MTLVLGLGMCLSMQVIGNGGLLMTGAGILLGVLGIVGVGLNYPVYKSCCAPARKSTPSRSCSWPGRSAKRESEHKEGGRMNKSESKYFNTALRMDEALIALLEEKDLEYITVKEICRRAGVNRSTFYLHYETIADLTDEAMDMIDRRFESYFPRREEEITDGIASRERKELVLVTREYLLPYLRFIRDNKKVYRAAFRAPGSVQAARRYGNLRQRIIGPVLERFGVPAAHRPYYMVYYVEGIAAIVKEWLRRDCEDDVEMVAGIIEACVRPREGFCEK